MAGAVAVGAGGRPKWIPLPPQLRGMGGGGGGGGELCKLHHRVWGIAPEALQLYYFEFRVMKML